MAGHLLAARSDKLNFDHFTQERAEIAGGSEGKTGEGDIFYESPFFPRDLIGSGHANKRVILSVQDIARRSSMITSQVLCHC